MLSVEFTGVRKVYASGDAEVVALDTTDLTVNDDEIVAVMGPSGSGKTTLLSIAGGLLSATEGRVVVAGREITGLRQRQLTDFRRTEVGFVFQAANLVPFLTARENLMVASDLAGLPSRRSKERADRLLEELGLSHRRNALPQQMSGGERQRTAIGRALINEPKVVLIDEPTSALDTGLGQQVMELIRSEVKGRETAAVLVTHDERMTSYADRMLRIVDGRLEVNAHV